MASQWLDSITAITGLSCSGKTTGARILAAHLGRPYYEASKIMRSFFEEHGSPEESLDNFAFEWLQKYPTAVPRRVLQSASDRAEKDIIVSGLRSPIELEHMRERARSFHSIYVDAPFLLRHERCLSRGRADLVRSVEEFAARDEIQERMGMDVLRFASGTLSIDNASTFENFQNTLRKLITV